MQAKYNQIRFLAAGLVLASGAAYAGHRLTTPPKYTGPTATEIRRVAERVPSDGGLTPTAVLKPPSPRVAQNRTAGPSQADPPARVDSVPSPSAADVAPLETEEEAPLVNPDESPVKSIALTGVTSIGDGSMAWLVDLTTNEREVAGEGEEAFGFTVQEINGDHVILAHGSEAYPLRLWEHREVDAAAGEVAPSPPAPSPTASDPRSSRRRFAASQPPAGRSPSRSFRSSRRRSSSQRSAAGRSAAYNRGYRRTATSSNRGNQGTTTSRLPFGLMRNSGGGNNQSARQNTSNPQTSRRTRARLIGGAPRIQEPSAVSNPQTFRRRGTRTGRAFGTERSASNQSRR